VKLTLRVWRQKNAQEAGRLVSYTAHDVSPDMSFLEMLDVVNEHLIEKGEEAIAFDSDCREGICGSCSLVINGVPHGANVQKGTATCQLHMRKFKDGDVSFKIMREVDGNKFEIKYAGKIKGDVLQGDVLRAIDNERAEETVEHEDGTLAVDLQVLDIHQREGDALEPLIIVAHMQEFLGRAIGP